jgi:hypothetical protein
VIVLADQLVDSTANLLVSRDFGLHELVSQNIVWEVGKKYLWPPLRDLQRYDARNLILHVPGRIGLVYTLTIFRAHIGRKIREEGIGGRNQCNDCNKCVDETHHAGASQESKRRVRS